VAIERNNTALEFETMLRRHLKRGGAPVAACAGFDFDAASACLEDALGRPARARFETHLAGCAACRRHLIELARLSQLAPQAETPLVAVAGQAPVRIRWKETVAGWFDFSAWSWKWQTIGAAGAAVAVLIAALSVPVWQRMSKPASDLVVAQSSGGALSAAEPASPSPESSPQILGDGNFAALSDQSLARPDAGVDARVPKPEVGLKQGEGEIAVVPSDKSLNLAAGRADQLIRFDFGRTRSGALPESPQLNSPPQPNPAPPLPPSVAGAAERVQPQVAARLAGQSQAEAADVADGSGRRNVTAQITPPPEYNPMIYDSEKPPPPRNQTQSGKAELQKAESHWRNRVMGFLPDRKPEPERKTSIGKEDDESFKPMTVRIRDKVFRFERNLWVDQDYKPALMGWRVLKLVRGSKDYEKVLADDPRLKEFFDHGPIIIVWKDKIYKVVSR